MTTPKRPTMAAVSVELTAFVAACSERLLERAAIPADHHPRDDVAAVEVLRNRLHDAARGALGPAPELPGATPNMPENPIDPDALAALIDASLEAAVVELRLPADWLERQTPEYRERWVATFTDARRRAIVAGRRVAAERLRLLAGSRP